MGNASAYSRSTKKVQSVFAQTIAASAYRSNERQTSVERASNACKSARHEEAQIIGLVG
jgi:hypothetical protein